MKHRFHIPVASYREMKSAFSFLMEYGGGCSHRWLFARLSLACCGLVLGTRAWPCVRAEGRSLSACVWSDPHSLVSSSQQCATVFALCPLVTSVTYVYSLFVECALSCFPYIAFVCVRYFYILPWIASASLLAAIVRTPLSISMYRR